MTCRKCSKIVVQKIREEKESANKMKLTYTNVNGYLIPNLTYKSGEHLLEVDKAAREREESDLERIDLCLNECDEVVECDLIVV